MNNVMIQNGEPLLIDMADVCYGHPIFDLSHIYLSHVAMGQSHPELTKTFMGIDADQALYIWDKTLEIYFDTKDKAKLKALNDLIGDFSLLKTALGPVTSKNVPERYIQFGIQKTRTKLFPIIDRLIATEIPF